ncbi:MAG TPA: adenosylcobinamide kinase/adenosylcobinamide phosphate guanyltransferase [Synechococcales bacterium UBA10510]|nr:adenosylcobinamide kinase/adenosylcobinamide phosphate guanyltransferase [Synechococcales bacterium UBA10510]
MAAEAPPQPGSLTLVLGAARSGKSRWAEHLASCSRLAVTYLATASPRPDDPLWQARLQLHRQRRPAHWDCLEIAEPERLPGCLERLAASQLALVDSLGSWVAAGLDLEADAWLQLCDQLETGLIGSEAAVVLVSEQTGWGLVPPTAIGGLFRDRLGALERRLVAISSGCWLVVAGRALNLLAQSQAVPSD